MLYDNATILGASGFVGSRLVRDLVSRGATGVRALDISPPRERLAGVEYLTADVRSPIPAAAARGASLIYNLAATHRTPGHPEHEYFETNVAGALNTVALAKECDVQTIVFTSSISVYGPCEEEVCEDTPLSPVSAYGRSKRLAEHIHQQWLADGSGRRLVIARPGVIFGPGERGNYTALAKALRSGYFFYPGRRDTVKSGGYVDELIDIFDFALNSSHQYALFNFAYPEQSTIQQIVSAFGRVSGRDYKPFTVPWPILRSGAGLFEAAAAMGVKTVIHPDRVMKLVQSTRVYPRWLVSRGYEFRTDLEAALRLWRDETDGRFE